MKTSSNKFSATFAGKSIKRGSWSQSQKKSGSAEKKLGKQLQLSFSKFTEPNPKRPQAAKKRSKATGTQIRLFFNWAPIFD